MDKSKKGFILIIAIVLTLLFTSLIVVGSVYNRRVGLRTADFVSKSKSQRNEMEEAYWFYVDKNSIEVPINVLITYDHVKIQKNDGIKSYEFYVKDYYLLIRKDYYE